MDEPVISRHSHSPWIIWSVLLTVLFCGALVLRFNATLFGPDELLINMPVLIFTGSFLVIAFVFWLLAPYAIRTTSDAWSRNILWLMILSGVLLRLLFLGGSTIMESDYNRYLWDGAVVANGINPYALAPDAVFETAQPGETLYTLQEQSGPVFDRINHPQFSTVYPPIAQAAFALSYLISPFDLDIWRLVLFAFEVFTLILVMSILGMMGKSLLWSGLYWLNPLVLKEVANSAHMEPLLMLPVMGAVWMILKSRYFTASIFLTLAAGIKIWPILLLLPIWRQMLHIPKKLFGIAFICGGILLLLLFPIIIAGLSPTSGFVAFASQWNSSSALYLVLLQALDPIAELININALDGPRLARLFIAVSILAICFAICARSARDNDEIIRRVFLITVTIYLLAPSHTPWYFLWIAPFLCIYPVRGLLLAGVTMTLHYSYFHFLPRDIADSYHQGVVWLIWLPVWGLLAADMFKQYSVKTAHA